MHRTIRDAMHRGVVTCVIDVNTAEAAKTMLDNDVAALVVVDEHLNACGVVSKTDLIGLYGNVGFSVNWRVLKTRRSGYKAITLMKHNYTNIDKGFTHKEIPLKSKFYIGISVNTHFFGE